MSYLKISKVCLFVSSLLVLASLFLVLVSPKPRFSIEFSGGTLIAIQIPDKAKQDVEEALSSFRQEAPDLGNVNIATVRGQEGESFILRMRPLSNEEHVALLQHFQGELGPVKELQFTTIGPSVSRSLKSRAIAALAVASLVVTVYLALSFRNLPRKLNPWKFGALAVLAFLHDIILTAGIFTIISHYTSFEYDTLFVTALLTILAYSVNDTIVIFDRIRSSLIEENRGDSLEATTVRGLKEVAMRTMHTTVTALIMLFSLFILGATSIKWFMLALIIGTFIGTYSSYFVAAPLLLLWSKKGQRK